MKLPRVPRVLVMGTLVPVTLLGLIGATFVLSLVGVLGARAGLPLLEAGALVPGRVLAGEAWRLFTWPLFETDPIGLIFACLMLWWFGRDLSQAWGEWRFLGVFFGFSGVVGGAVTLLAWLVWPALRLGAWATAWPIADALVIAWAVQFPYRQLLLYFLFPLGGRNLIYLTVGGTLLFAAFYGVSGFLPHLLAVAFMLVFARYPALDLIWMRARLALLHARSRRPSHLREVEKREPPRWVH
jgi:membrane associated rhomboid family serine protease